MSEAATHASLALGDTMLAVHVPENATKASSAPTAATRITVAPKIVTEVPQVPETAPKVKFQRQHLKVSPVPEDATWAASGPQFLRLLKTPLLLLGLLCRHHPFLRRLHRFLLARRLLREPFLLPKMAPKKMAPIYEWRREAASSPGVTKGFSAKVRLH